MTSATNPKTIELYGMGCQLEAIADGTITPGMLVERTSTGVQAHGTQGETANTSFANEMGMVGGTIDDDYEDGDQVIFTTYAQGSGVYALVGAGAAAITAGDFLTSAGDGTLEKVGANEVVVAQALEDVDNSGEATTARIRVEVVSAQRTSA